MLRAIKTSTSCIILKMAIFGIGIMVLGSSVVNCGDKSVSIRGEEKGMSEETIEEALKEHTDTLMAVPGVVGTGQGLCDGKPCIKVYVIKETPELEPEISNILGGYPFVIKETGRIRALPENQD
jgi:hypothetical protein